MKRRFFAVVGALHLVLAAACGSQRAGAVSITEAHSPPARGSALGVPDTCIYVNDIADGAEVAFTTTPPYVAGLRSRVSEQAAVHGPGSHQGPGHGGLHETSQGHGLRLWTMPVRTVREIETERGVRLEIIATEPAKATELRAQLRERVEKLRDRGCP